MKIYLIGLWRTIWVVQWWLPRVRKTENPVTVQSLAQDVSVVPIWCRSPGGFLGSCWSSVCFGIPEKLVMIQTKECCSNSADGLPSKSEGKQVKSKGSFFCGPFCSCHQKMLPRFKVGFPASNQFIKKITHRGAQSLGFSWVQSSWHPTL